jgi:hypothetical protein
MRTIETKSAGYSLARGRQLIAEGVGELEARAGIGTRPGGVPMIENVHCFRKIQRNRPAAQGGSAGVGDIHLQLEIGAAVVCNPGIATVRRKRLPGGHHNHHRGQR